MSYKFVPYTSLLNNIYVPFYELAKKSPNLNLKNFGLEADVNGVLSTINLNTENKKYLPFIDISRYDFSRKDWFYYNSDGFPYRLTYNAQNFWDVEPVYGEPATRGYTDSLVVTNLYDRDITIQLGIYITATDYDGSGDLQFYKGIPISVVIQDIPLIDITNYSNPNIKPMLNNIGSDINKEFYYDFDQNRIFTNQNLAGVDPVDVNTRFYTTTNEVNIKCRMATNEIDVSDVTPIVDYYIAKLSGQDLRG